MLQKSFRELHRFRELSGGSRGATMRYNAFHCFLDRFRTFQDVSQGYKGALQTLRWAVRTEVLRRIQRCFKCVSNAFQGVLGGFQGVLRGSTRSWISFTGISGEFQRYFKGLQCISEHFKAFHDVSEGFRTAFSGLHLLSCFTRILRGGGLDAFQGVTIRFKAFHRHSVNLITGISRVFRCVPTSHIALQCVNCISLHFKRLHRN